ncbi:MAG: succinate dehydrogenase, cytochrome b556 subunit [Rickettsiaceae bacterium]
MPQDPLLVKNSRPLSPHLTIYKPQISSVLSIGHRLSGIGLFIALSVFCWWFIFWVFSKFEPCYLKCFDLGSIKCILFIASYGYFYHLCTGIRHLVWDAGWGFSINSINYTGWAVVIASIILTIVYWLGLI